MKYILLLLSIAITTGCTETKQHQESDHISKEDSIKAEGYWTKANQSSLFSEQRQNYLDSALAIDPKNAYYWQQKAMPLSKQMKHELAAPYLDSAAKYNPAKYVEYRGFMNCIFRRHYRDALNDFDIARSINGNSGVMDHPYDFYTGICHLQLNNFDSAEHYFSKSIEEKAALSGHDWVHYLHWFYLGIAMYEKEDITTAQNYFDSSLKLNKYLPEAHYYKGRCLARNNKLKEALTEFKTTQSLLDKGYFINEDNARYERYPYQVVPFYLYGIIGYLEKQDL